MKDRKAAIARIGRKLVACDQKCGGISCNQSKGILPRCLILESKGRSGGPGCVVVGINPGHARRAEKAYYKREGAKYKVVEQYWHRSITIRAYYKKLRDLMDAFGLDGPILWTELAKCESARGTKLPPLETLRSCTGRFLIRELELISKKWPLIGVGKEAYHALAYQYPVRTVIGVLHPMGAYGNKFSQILPGGRLYSKSKKTVRRALSNPPGELIWIGADGGL